MHRMRVELEIEYPVLVVCAVNVEFDDLPQTRCPMIADDSAARFWRRAARPSAWIGVSARFTS